MARRNQQTFAKRLREHKRDEKNRAKQLKREQRKEGIGIAEPESPFPTDSVDGGPEDQAPGDGEAGADTGAQDETPIQRD